MKQKFYEAKMYRNINICISYIGWGVIHKLFRMTLSGLVDMNYDVLKFKKQFIRANIYLPVQHNNRSTRKKCEICPKLTIKTPERRHQLLLCVCIINFEQLSQVFLVFLFSAVNFEQVNVCWEISNFMTLCHKSLILNYCW